MSVSTVLSVWGYPGELTAQRTARRLSAAVASAPTVDDVAVLSWPAEQQRPTAWQARELATAHPLSGAFWGLLFGQLFLLPICLKVAPALAVDGLDDVLARLGVGSTFLHAVRDRVVPGTSALFVLDSTGTGAESALPEVLGAEAVELGELRLSADHAARLRAGFDDE